MSDMNIGDKVKIINTGDVWEGKSGILEYLDEYIATVLVDFIDDKKVRQDFNVDNISPIDSYKEPDIINTDEKSPKLKEDFKMNVEEIKQKLADYLDVDVETIDQGYDEDIFTVDNEEEYLVCYLVCTEDEAREKAKEEVRRAFEDMGLDAFSEYFQEWILENAVDGELFDDMQHSYYMQYVDDIEYENDEEFENRLYAELFDNGLLKEEDFEDEDHVGSALKDEIYEHIDHLKSEYVDILCNTEDPMDFIKGMFGGSDLADFIMENNAIDIDKVAEECVDEDGCGHHLAYYDGREIDLGGGMFAYRRN